MAPCVCLPVAVALCLWLPARSAVEAPATAETYLSHEIFPGLHILEWVNAGSDLRLYPRGQRPQAGKKALLAESAGSWESMAQARSTLHGLLRIPEIEPLQTPWALFDAQGHRLQELADLKQASVAFLLEIGQWMWPAVRVGFEHQVRGVFGEKSAILRTLSLRPVVFEVQNFLSLEETEQIMALGLTQGLTRSEGVMQTEDLIKGTQHTDFRTSRQAWLEDDMSPLMTALDKRVSRLTRVPRDHNEDAQLLRYDGGEFYESHMDWNELELYDDQRQVWKDYHFGWQDRMGNVFWYLNDVEEGGHTIFPKHGKCICKPNSRGGPDTRQCPCSEDPYDMSDCETGLKVYPKRGSVILWYNHHPNGRGDRNSLHGGCPVGKNMTKWSANKWFSIKPLELSGARWVDDHPALARHGWRGTNDCHAGFMNEAGERANIMWKNGTIMQKVGNVAPGDTFWHKSRWGHRFALWAGSRKSNVLRCSKNDMIFTLNKEFKLRQVRSHDEEL